jgi:hypothetical protein
MAWKKQKQANLVFLIAFIVSAVSFASMARTGYLGGQIRHTEIANGAGTGNQTDNEKEKEKTGDKDDD